jgi:hypothetical protein
MSSDSLPKIHWRCVCLCICVCVCERVWVEMLHERPLTTRIRSEIPVGSFLLLFTIYDLVFKIQDPLTLMRTLRHTGEDNGAPTFQIKYS